MGVAMMMPEVGVVVGGRYVLIRLLAKGGMGSVWIARHRELDVDVTVKFMMPTLIESTELRARFEREAKVAARLRSQHVVQVLDFGIDDGMPYIAMELLQGENLGDRMKREPRIPLPDAAQILGQVCKALRTAHEAGLVHRDLKPGNIFLAVKDGEHVVKVLDFGIVKETGKNDADEVAGATETGVMMGSVHYMSPEQIRSSRQVDHRSDLWSVAVILYKMLTGNAPFPGTNTGDVMVRVCTNSFSAPSSVVPGLPASIDAFFVRALTRDPAGRFQSAQEMADAIVTAVSTAATYKPQKWAKTLPLHDDAAALRPAIDPESGASGQLPRPPQPSVYPNDSAVPAPRAPQPSVSAEASYVQTAPGTFQGVTMPRAQLVSSPGTAIAAPKPPSNIQKGVVLGVAFGVVIMGLVVSLLLSQKSSVPDESAQAAPGPTQSFVSANPNSVGPVQPMANPQSSSVPSEVMPLPATASTTASLLQPAKTNASAAMVPKSAPSPRKNPLDIND